MISSLIGNSIMPIIIDLMNTYLKGRPEELIALYSKQDPQIQ